MNAFTFATCQQLICEAGCSGRLGQICQEQGISRALIVTDAAIEQLALHQNALDSLKQSQVAVQVYSQVVSDPPEAVVYDAVNMARQTRCDAVIGLGGGSSMDVAKLVALLAHPQCTESLQALYGVNPARKKRLRLIQVPTTAGTGSEVTQVAIVTTGETTKMGAVCPAFLPDIALLDCELTLGLPPQVTAATGIDAMVHAIEAYTGKIRKNPLSDLMAKEALRLLAGNIRHAVHSGRNKSAREAMLLGAMYAGQAFSNSPVAAVHALAYPLGGHFHIPHGLTNSLVLPHVMRFNLPAAADLYAELAPLLFPEEQFSGTTHDTGEQLIDLLELLIRNLGLPTTLREMDISEAVLPKLAEDAMLQTRLLVNNPREMSFESALAIYHAAY